MNELAIALLVVAGLFLIALIASYNALVGRRNQVRNVFGGIDAFLRIVEELDLNTRIWTKE
jgi:hypothetical protein